jgi:hypothetical protein
MPKNYLYHLLTAAAIAAAIILVELVKSKAISAFWKTTGAA